MAGPLLWGPNNTSNNLQSQILSSSGELIQNNGAKNYINYNNFENGLTTGWGLGTTGTLTNGIPTGTPTFGSGASGNLSLSVITSGQLAGTASLGLVSSAATTVGNMMHSDALPIDAADRAQVLTFKFSYSVPTNPANGNFSGTSSNTYGIAVYDVTNSAWLGLAGNFAITQNSGAGIATGTMQTAINTASVRFVIYCVTASAGAITMEFDRFFLGPQTSPIGAVVTDPVAYTPTISGFGTVTGVNFRSWRVGANLFINGVFTTGTPAASPAQITLGFNGGNANVSSASNIPAVTLVGMGDRNAAGAENYGFLAAPSTNYLSIGIQTSARSGLTASNGNDIIGSGQTLAVNAIVPIAGWSSNVQMSSDTDTRVIAASMGLTSAQAVGANSPIKFDTVTFDSSASYSTVTGLYTAPVTGYYRISAVTLTNAGTSIYLNVNGTARGSMYVSVAGATNSGSSVVRLNAGDTIGVYTEIAGTFNATGALGFFNSASIERLSGPAVIAATETVACNYSGISSTSVTGGVAPTWVTKVFDTHNAFNGTSFIVPVSGIYRCSMYGQYAATTFSDITLRKNGATVSFIGSIGTFRVTLAGIVQANAGDVLNIRFDTSGTIADATNIYTSYERIK